MKTKHKTSKRPHEPAAARRTDPNIPAEAARLADDAAREYTQRLRADLDARKKAAEEILERGRRKLRALVSDRDWFALRAQMQRERAALCTRLQPPDGVGRDALKEHETLKRRINAAVRGLGISADQVRKASDAVFEELTHSASRRWAVSAPARESDAVFEELTHSAWARPRIPEKNFGTAAPLGSFAGLLGGIAGSGVFTGPHDFITLGRCRPVRWCKSGSARGATIRSSPTT